MRIELRCPDCDCGLSAPPQTPADEIIERMIDDGPWFALGEGATFEDMIFTALTHRGRISCPECRSAVAISEATLGQYAREMLACG